jgi:hypothetical protein
LPQNGAVIPWRKTTSLQPFRSTWVWSGDVRKTLFIGIGKAMLGQMVIRVQAAAFAALVALVLAFFAIRHFSPELALALDNEEAFFIWLALAIPALVFGLPMARTYLLLVPVFAFGWFAVASYEGAIQATSLAIMNDDGSLNTREAMAAVLLIFTEVGHRSGTLLFGALDENQPIVAFFAMGTAFADWVVRVVLTGLVLFAGIFSWSELRSWRVGRNDIVPQRREKGQSWRQTWAMSEGTFKVEDRQPPSTKLKLPIDRDHQISTSDCPRCREGRCRPHGRLE